MRRLLFLLALLFFAAPARAAFTDQGPCGIWSQNSSTTAWTVQLSSAIEQYHFFVIVIAVDNDGNGTNNDEIGVVTNATSGDLTSVTENEEDPGTAGQGAAVGIFIGSAPTTISIGANLTINYATAKVAMAATCREFSVTAISSFTVDATASATGDTANGDAPSLVYGSLPNREHLWLRGTASETNVSSYSAVTAGFTLFFSTGVDTGSEASSMGVAGEFFIGTATTKTSDPTSADTTADRACSFRSVMEDQTASLPTSRRRTLVQ